MTFVRVPIRRVVRLVNGGTPNPDPENWGGEVPWATPVDLARVDGGSVCHTDRTLTREGLLTGSSVIPSGQILLSTRAPIGYVATSETELAFNQGCKGLVTNSRAEPVFLKYQLLASRQELQGLGSGSTFLELSSESLLAWPVALPPIEDQRRIADFLDDQVARIDATRSLVTTQRSLLAEHQKSLITAAVTGQLDLDTGKPRADAHAGAGVSVMLPTETRWPSVAARRVLVRQSRPVPHDAGTVTAFRDGEVILRSERRTEGFTESVLDVGYQGVEVGDLVIHSMDAFAGAMGVSKSVGKMSPVVHIYTGPDDVDLRFQQYYLRHLALSDYVQSLAKGIRERSTSFDPATLADVPLPLPPVEEQRRIADFLDKSTAHVKDTDAALEQLLTRLEEYKRSLITAAVTGEFDVSTASGRGVPA